MFLPILRDSHPPCGSCPKGTDPNAPEIIGPDFNDDRTAWPCNLEAYMMYRSVKLMGGAARVPAHLEYCSVFHEVMLTVDQVVQLVDAEKIQLLRQEQEDNE